MTPISLPAWTCCNYEVYRRLEIRLHHCCNTLKTRKWEAREFWGVWNIVILRRFDHASKATRFIGKFSTNKKPLETCVHLWWFRLI
jgi:hypothetical protein